MPNKTSFMLIDKEQRYLYVATDDGNLSFYDLADKSAPALKQQLDVLTTGQKINSMVLLNGGLSLLIADSSGLVSQWGLVRDASNNPDLKNCRIHPASW